MYYYKDDNDGIYAVSKKSSANTTWTQITKTEYDSLNVSAPETAEQVIARLEAALDRHLDTVANSYRYESIRTMVTYATSEHPTFGLEGRAAVKFRDAVYAYGIQVIADVQAEIRTIPTEAELIAELPQITDFIQ
jgi:hypothetical protein